MDFLTPSQLLEQYPQVRQLWNEREIGYLFMLKLVNGRKFPRTCVVDASRVLKLYKEVKEMRKTDCREKNGVITP